jgi:hypothetical protein
MILLLLKYEDVELCGLLERFFQQDVTDSDWNQLNEIVDLKSSKGKSDVELRHFEDFWKPQLCQTCKYKPVESKQRKPPQAKSFWNVWFSEINRVKFYILFYIAKFLLGFTSFESYSSFFHFICWIVYLMMSWDLGNWIAYLLLFTKSALTFLTYVVRNEMDHLIKCRMPSYWENKVSGFFVTCLILFDYSIFPIKYNDLFGLC